MKKIITILIAALPVFALAQNEADTTKLKFGGTKIIIIKGGEIVDSMNVDDDFDFDIDTNDFDDDSRTIGLESEFLIGANGYLTPSNGLNLPASQNLFELDYAQSRAFAMNFMLKGIDIIKDRWYISPGIGLTYNGYRFKNGLNIGTGSDTLLLTKDTVRNFSKQKLRSTYLQVPLVMGFRIGNVENKPLGIEFGVIGGYRIGSKLKEKFEADDSRYKNKIKDDFNFNPFQLSATARIGIGRFGIYANYGLTSVFQKDKAPELYPFQVGVVFNGF